MEAYLHSAMTQTRPNSCMLLHGYKNINNQLFAEKVVNPFVDGYVDKK